MNNPPPPLSACCKADYIIATKPHLMSNSEPYPMCTTCGLPCDLQPPAESGGYRVTDQYERAKELLTEAEEKGAYVTELMAIFYQYQKECLSLESKLRLALDALDDISVGRSMTLDREELKERARETLAQIQLLTPSA